MGNEIDLRFSIPFDYIPDSYSSPSLGVAGRHFFGEGRLNPLVQGSIEGWLESRALVYESATTSDPCLPDTNTAHISSFDGNILSQYPFLGEDKLRHGSLSIQGGGRFNAGKWSFDGLVGPGLTSLGTSDGSIYSNLWSDPNNCGQKKVAETEGENLGRVLSLDGSLAVQYRFGDHLILGLDTTLSGRHLVGGGPIGRTISGGLHLGAAF